MKLLLLVSVLWLQALQSHSKRVICYWVNYRMTLADPDKHLPENIDPTLCTHIHYAFHILDNKTNTVMESAGGGPRPKLYERLNKLRQKNKQVKLILAVGGGAQACPPFSAMITSPTLRVGFIKNTIAYLKKYNFDGLDLAWEYPHCWYYDCSLGPQSDVDNYGKLLTEFRAAFNNNKPRLLLSAAIPSGYSGGPGDVAYDMPTMAAALDYMSVMTYDFVAATWSSTTGHHTSFDGCVSAVEFYVNKGMPKNKIVMGVPAYAHTFTLQSADQHGMNAPVVGVGQVPSGNPGYAMYREMCDLVKNKGWIKEIPDDSGAHDPIAYSGVNWACYDDPFAANNKSMWVKENGYGGINVWEITQDDFHPKCCKKAYPLLRAINHGLFNKTNWPYTYGCEPKTSST